MNDATARDVHPHSLFSRSLSLSLHARAYTRACVRACVRVSPPQAPCIPPLPPSRSRALGVSRDASREQVGARCTVSPAFRYLSMLASSFAAERLHMAANAHGLLNAPTTARTRIGNARKRHTHSIKRLCKRLGREKITTTEKGKQSKAFLELSALKLQYRCGLLAIRGRETCSNCRSPKAIALSRRADVGNGRQVLL